MEKIIFAEFLGVMMISVVMDIFLEYIHSKIFVFSEPKRKISKYSKNSEDFKKYFLFYMLHPFGIYKFYNWCNKPYEMKRGVKIDIVKDLFYLMVLYTIYLYNPTIYGFVNNIEFSIPYVLLFGVVIFVISFVWYYIISDEWLKTHDWRKYVDKHDNEWFGYDGYGQENINSKIK